MPKWLLFTLEAAFLAALLLGVAMIYIPAAFIMAGVLGILACEWASSKAKL